MKRKNKMACCLVVSGLLLSGLSAASGQPKGVVAKEDVLHAFDLGEVQLLPGRRREAFDEVKDYFMGIPNDDMLHEYRLSIGETNPPGKRLGGWYKELIAVPFPQWLSFYSRLYAVTGDPACKAKAEYLIDEWWNCFTKASALMLRGCSLNGSNGSNDKLILALLDVYRYCGQDEKYLERLHLFVKWLEAWSNRSRQFGDNNTEWWTMPWPMYQAYILTGKEEYRDFAEFWEYREYWDQFAKQPVTPFEKTPVTGMNTEYCHAYSHINSFNSAAEAYRVKGDVYYLAAMKNAYDWMQTGQMFATGLFGARLEHLRPIGLVAERLTCRADHGESPCDTWAAFRFAKNLTTLTGEARYGNWIERLSYNAVDALIPMTSDGNGIYYSNYNMNGAMKLNSPIEWTCCMGTRPLNQLQYFINTYYYDADRIYVNLFIPSTVTWSRDKNKVTLMQNTDFPYSDRTEFAISTGRPDRFGVAIRIPEWLSGTMTVRVNGRSVKSTTEKGWLVVNRQWKNGDKLSVEMPMDFWLSVLDKSQEGPTAVMYGPLAMAFTTPDLTLRELVGENDTWSYDYHLSGNPDQALLNSIDLENIKNLVTPVNDKLEFALKFDNSVRLKPFMDYGEKELYYMYLETRNP